MSSIGIERTTDAGLLAAGATLAVASLDDIDLTALFNGRLERKAGNSS
ncbi:MAG: hypothetical protein JXA67_07840 [Micromonosporaceae bacterium]|nr:hypothetical protein [Micromonosporaceae bacterium]